MYYENALLHTKTAKIMANQRYEKGKEDRFSVGSVRDLFADLTVQHPCDLPAKVCSPSQFWTKFIHHGDGVGMFHWKQRNRLIMLQGVSTQKKPSFYNTHYKNLKTYPKLHVFLFWNVDMKVKENDKFSFRRKVHTKIMKKKTYLPVRIFRFLSVWNNYPPWWSSQVKWDVNFSLSTINYLK
jgi:hypothetical protein